MIVDAKDIPPNGYFRKPMGKVVYKRIANDSCRRFGLHKPNSNYLNVYGVSAKGGMSGVGPCALLETATAADFSRQCDKSGLDGVGVRACNIPVTGFFREEHGVLVYKRLSRGAIGFFNLDKNNEYVVGVASNGRLIKVNKHCVVIEKTFANFNKEKTVNVTIKNDVDPQVVTLQDAPEMEPLYVVECQDVPELCTCCVIFKSNTASGKANVYSLGNPMSTETVGQTLLSAVDLRSVRVRAYKKGESFTVRFN